MPRPLARGVLEGISGLASPNASAAASDVWNSGLYPGETDFRYLSASLDAAAVFKT